MACVTAQITENKLTKFSFIRCLIRNETISNGIGRRRKNTPSRRHNRFCCIEWPKLFYHLRTQQRLVVFFCCAEHRDYSSEVDGLKCVWKRSGTAPFQHNSFNFHVLVQTGVEQWRGWKLNMCTEWKKNPRNLKKRERPIKMTVLCREWAITIEFSHSNGWNRQRTMQRKRANRNRQRQSWTSGFISFSCQCFNGTIIFLICKYVNASRRATTMRPSIHAVSMERKSLCVFCRGEQRAFEAQHKNGRLKMQTMAAPVKELEAG